MQARFSIWIFLSHHLVDVIAYKDLNFSCQARDSKLRKDEKYLKYFMMYEQKFKNTQSLRDFMEQDDEYPKEIFGDQQVMRLNPRPIHYEF